MSVRPFPLGVNLYPTRFEKYRNQFRDEYPTNDDVRNKAVLYAARRVDLDDFPHPSYLALLSLWNDTDAQRTEVANNIFHLKDEAGQHIGKTIMVMQAGTIESLNEAQTNLQATPRKYAKMEPAKIVVGRVRRAQGEGWSASSNLNYRTRVLKSSPHPTLDIPSPSLSFETSLAITHRQELSVDEFGGVTVETDVPTGTAADVLMIEGGSPLSKEEDYQAGRQVRFHEFVIGDEDAFTMASLLYELHNRGDMSEFDGRGVTDYLAMPDLNEVFTYGTPTRA